MENNKKIVGALNNGDVKAYEQIFHMLYARLCAFAMKYVKEMDDAEEIVEDAMVVLWEKREKFNDIDSLKSYLYVTVRNASLDSLKKKNNEESLDVLQHLQSMRKADDFIIEEEVHALLFQAVESLPEKCRKILQLSFVEGLKYKDIAEDLGITINTVKSQRSRALELLKLRLKNLPYYIIILCYIKIVFL